MKLNLGRDSEAMFGRDFEFYFVKMNSTLGSVVPLAMFDYGSHGKLFIGSQPSTTVCRL